MKVIGLKMHGENMKLKQYLLQTGVPFPVWVYFAIFV